MRCALLVVWAGAGFVTTALAALLETSVAVTGHPTVLGGPVTDDFDQPYLTINASSVVRGYSSNAKTYVFATGTNSTAILPVPYFTGLGPSNSSTALDHCGAWLNAAYVDPSNESVIAGFYHEEWNCDYSNNFFTNKSVAFALSTDGGITFSKPYFPSNAIILPANSTSAHQTGEGDHGTVAVGAFLYLFFTEWDGPGGRTTVGVARAPATSLGTPGTWTKWLDGAWQSPGLGGNSTLLNGILGTAVCASADQSQVWTIGGMGFGGSLGAGFAPATDLIASWSRLSVPLTVYDASSWARGPGVPELRGYPSLLDRWGSKAAVYDEAQFVVTYWPVGSWERYLVSQPVTFGTYSAPPASPLAAFALWPLSRYYDVSGNNTIDTTAPLPLPGTVLENTTLLAPSEAYLLTSNATFPANSTVTLLQCDVRLSPTQNDSRVATPEECATTPGGVAARTLGWGYALSVPLADIPPVLLQVASPSPLIASPAPLSLAFAPQILYRCDNTGLPGGSTVSVGAPCAAGTSTPLAAVFQATPSTRALLVARSGI
jgi:hypothetical protein